MPGQVGKALGWIPHNVNGTYLKSNAQGYAQGREGGWALLELTDT